MANSGGRSHMIIKTFFIVSLACLIAAEVVVGRGAGRRGGGRRGAGRQPAGGTGAGRQPAGGTGTVFDITKFGAKPNGGKSNELSIIRAWRAACDSPGPAATLLVPRGNFIAGEIIFRGPCKGQKLMTVQIQGNLLALDDVTAYPGKGWINVENVNNVVITGGGTVNGRGSSSWEYAKGAGPLPASIQFQSVGFGKIYNLNLVDSMGVHTKVSDSHDITMWNLKINAPATSPNTDGCHISNTTTFKLTDSTIGTGDDCVSIGHGSNNVLVARVTCGPGHGISIGSLGKRPDELNVKGITVSNCIIKGATNGARIKTYHQSPQLQATGIIFQDIVMDRVQNPIIIDQNYNSNKNTQPSRVKISDVHFRNIRGTTTSPIPISLQCSSLAPCQGVELADINLVPFGRTGPLKSVCSKANAYVRGKYSLPTPLKCV